MTKRWPIRPASGRQQASSSDADLQARAEREAQRQRVDAFLASRDAGESLTSDALDRGIDVPAVVAAATSVADYTDRALAIVEEEYRPALQCREGCAYCCCKPGVLVTVPELLRVLSAVDERFDADARTQLGSRAERYVKQIEGRHFNDAFDESVPCPLLVDSRCSVYDVRPLVCRGYNSTSVEACRAAHGDARQLIPIFTVLKDVTDGATVGMSQSLRQAGVNDAMLDLGSALNAALTSNQEFAAAILAGSPEYAEVEDGSWVGNLWARVQESARELAR
jgi:uncharacterized protein